MPPFDGLPKPPDDDRSPWLVPDAIHRDIEEVEAANMAEELSLRREIAGPLPSGHDCMKFWEASTSDGDETVRCVVRGWRVARTTLPKRYEDVRPHLIPIVRSLAAYHAHRLRMELAGKKSVDCPFYRVAHHLGAWLACDLPGAMQTVGQEDLDCWGVTFLEALHVARGNLLARGWPFFCLEKGDGFYFSADDKETGASWLLLPGGIREMPVRGDVVAMAINPDLLMITGSDDEEGLCNILDMTREALRLRGQMSTMALRLDGDRWVPWLPPAWHPLHNKFHRWRMRSLVTYYRTQERLLRELYEARGEPVAVYPFRVLPSKKGGLPLSVTRWPERGVAIVPRADIIAFDYRRYTDRAPIFPWEQVAEAAGHLMTPLDTYPTAWRVSRHMTDEEFEAMEAKSL
jgi:hypothetical protein